MDPVTIDLNGLGEFVNQFGHLGYIFAVIAAGLTFGTFSWRNIVAAGNAELKETERGSHIARAVISGIFSVVNMAVALTMAYEAFEKTL